MFSMEVVRGHHPLQAEEPYEMAMHIYLVTWSGIPGMAWSNEHL